MFGLLQKSKPQQDVYFPFKTVFEKEQLIFDKKQFASNGFDFVQKQRKRQNRCDDEKWVRSGDRPFTKAKRSNRDVPDQDELQTYASLDKMLDKAIHVVRQLKKKGNTNTFSALKHQCKSSYLSNSDLKTNEISFDKSKAVKPTSKAHSTRCFKCHRIGHYANKCQKQKPLVTLENENLETKPEKEDPLPIQKLDQTQDLRTNLFKEEGNYVPWFVDQSIGANQHEDQNVLNNLTETTEPQPVFPDQLDILRPTVEPDLAWVVKKPKMDMHSPPADHPDSPASVLIFTPCIHLPTHSFFLWWLALDRGYIKSHSASLDDPFNPSQFQKDGNQGVGPQTWPVKACCGAELGLHLVNPQNCGPRGTESKRDGSKAGRVQNGTGSKRDGSKARRVESGTGRKRDRSKAGRATGSMMLPVSQAPSICTGGASSSHHKKFENSLSTEEEYLVPAMGSS
uniref:CCHC-type domain-containing protein n=1 Tax=Brassica oleracea var. oleracea TaxID=109376 RepID=A0A0D3AVQ2_BRAOL